MWNLIDRKGKWAEGWEQQAAFLQLEVHIWFRDYGSPGAEGCQKSCTRIWSNFYIASLCRLHSSMKTHAWLNSHCCPTQRACSAHCRAEPPSPGHIHVTSQVKILNQTSSYKCAIYAGSWCQSGQTDGMGTKAPPGTHAVASIPTDRAGTWTCTSSTEIPAFAISDL